MSYPISNNVNNLPVYTSPLCFTEYKYADQSKIVQLLNPVELETVIEDMELRATSIAYYAGQFIRNIGEFIRSFFVKNGREIRPEYVDGLRAPYIDKVIVYKKNTPQHQAMEECSARIKLTLKLLNSCPEAAALTIDKNAVQCVIPKRIPLSSLLKDNKIYISTDNKMVLKTIIYHALQLKKTQQLERLLENNRCTIGEQNYLKNIILILNSVLVDVDSLARSCIKSGYWSEKSIRLRPAPATLEELFYEANNWGLSDFYFYARFKNCTKKIEARPIL